MTAFRHSPRLRAGFSIIFFLVGLIFALWETGLFWTRMVTAIRGFRGRRF